MMISQSIRSERPRPRGSDDFRKTIRGAPITLSPSLNDAASGSSTGHGSSLRAVETAPDGEAALLAFDDQNAEAAGVAAIVERLVTRDGIAPGDILVLFRGDNNEHFSKPIKALVASRGIAVSDPDLVDGGGPHRLDHFQGSDLCARGSANLA